MGWTTPKTWVTGDIFQRSDATTYWRNQQREMAPAKVTAKGDLLAGLAANSIAAVAVGANDSLVRADSAQTPGIKWSANEKIPSGLITLHTGSCPSGWSEYTAARGFAVVGTPSGGTDAGTVGSALTNLQDKTHAHAGASHTHVVTLVQKRIPGAVARPATSTDTATGTSGTSAISGSMSYVQLTFCSKD